MSCSAVRNDCRSVGPDEALHHDFPARSADPDGCHSVVRGEALRHDFQVRSAVQGEALRHDFQVRSAVRDDCPRHLAGPADSQGRSADPDDWLVRLAVLDELRGLSGDSGHRALHAATVEPERPLRPEPFSPEAAWDDLLRQDRRWAD